MTLFRTDTLAFPDNYGSRKSRALQSSMRRRTISIIAIAFVAVAVLFTCYNRPSPKNYAQAVGTAKQNIPVVSQFAKLYHNAEQRSSHYLEQNPSWQSSTTFYVRYEIEMTIDV